MRGHRRQRAMIDAACDLFIRNGYRGTTLEAIIARAGGSRETIYRVFGGKHGLFGAIITRSGKRLAESIVAPAALGLPPREGLRRLAVELVGVWDSAEGRAINHAVLSEGLQARELVDAWYNGGTKLSIDALSRYLDAQTTMGRLVEVDTHLVARQFLILLAGEVAFPILSGSTEPPDRAAQIERCIDLILRAYGQAK